MDVARIGVALGAEDEEFRLLASELLTTLVEAVDIPLDKEALTLARQISSQAAERVTRRLLVDVTDDDPNASGWATEMLEMTGPRLSSADAQQVASQLLEAMTRTRDSHQLARLARGLKAVSQGLSAATSERAAEWLVEVMTHESDLDDLCRLDGGLEEVWPWLPAAAAKRALATLSGARNACVIGRVARHLEQVGPQLLAPDADRATEQIVDRTLATEPWGQTEFQVNLKLGLTTKSPPKSPRSDHEKPRQLGRKMKPRDWKSGRAWTVGSDPNGGS